MKFIRRKLRGFIDDQRQCLAFYTRAAIIFFVGLASIIGSNYSGEIDLKQEIITLIGVIMMGLGFFFAMVAQVCLILGRFKRFNQRGNHDDVDP